MTCDTKRRAVLTSLDLVGAGIAKFVRMSGSLCLSSISRSVPVSRTRTEVRNNITSPYGDVAYIRPERDLYMRQAFGVGVVFGVFAQPLVDDELVELDLTTLLMVAMARYSWIRSTTTSVASPERI
jgi:hypothetical protein